MSTPLQRAHRQRIVAAWGVEEGSRLLEVGCGQGDTTEVLAEAVGPAGHVLAIDSAPRSYGSPMTLGEATDALKASPIGTRMQFRFETDILDGSDLGRFDAAVLSMSSWYFGSEEQLRITLARLRDVAARLYFAEWDLIPSVLEQLPHLLAVLIQARLYAIGNIPDGNVRTPLARAQALGVIESAGWTIDRVETVAAGELEDADWEIRNCLGFGSEPSVATEIALLASLAKESGNLSLDTFTVAAYN